MGYKKYVNPAEEYKRLCSSDIDKPEDILAEVVNVDNQMKKVKVLIESTDTKSGKFSEYLERQKDLKLTRKVLISNYRIALADRAIAAILLVLQKYKGRVMGSKTLEKVQNEIEELTGYDIVCNTAVNIKRFCSVTVDTKEYYQILKQPVDIEIRCDFVTETNKLKTISEDMLSFNFSRDMYVRNIPEYLKSKKQAAETSSVSI